MKVTYEVIDMDDATTRGLPCADFAWMDTSYCWGVWRCEDGVPVECIGFDGGEPEDQILIRDWAWVPLALQAAYDLGSSTLDGMTAEKLREIAGWLDTYDELAQSYLALVQVHGYVSDAERIARAVSTVGGKEVQTELQRWADAVASREQT